MLKLSLVVAFVAVLSLLFSSSSVSSQATPCLPANGGAADNVIGQVDFTSTAAGTTTSTLTTPIDLVVDITTFKVFVVDSGNNRVLRFSSLAAISDGAAAEASFGGTGAASATTLNAPEGVAFQNNQLFISDTGNNRVVRLDAASTNTTVTGAAFAGVIGQPDLVSFAVGTFTGPVGLAISFDGTLFVANKGAQTVLSFASAATINSAGTIDETFGTVGAVTCSAHDFVAPDSLAIDPFTDTLFISDSTCNRITGFSQAQLSVAADNQDFVIGQPDFTSSAIGCSATTLNVPFGLSYDGNSQTLFVADSANHRVLGYANALTVLNTPPTIAPATIVIGQADFATCALAGAASGSSLNTPNAAVYDSFFDFDLFVVDTANNRVLRFECPDSPSTSASGSISVSNSNSISVSNSHSISISNSVSGSGSGSASLTVTSSNSASGTASWTVTASGSASATTTRSASGTPSNSPVYCGDGVVDTSEQCDPGVGNFNKQTCCNTQCRYKRLQSKCGPKTGNPCTKRARCLRNSTTGAVECSPITNKRRGKFCKTSTITSGVCSGQGVCVAA